MIKLWSNFVKTGKPARRWPFYSQKNPDFVLIGPGDIFGIIETAPHGDNCNFYRQFFRTMINFICCIKVLEYIVTCQKSLWTVMYGL
ncbi:hypothetical protein CEXT_405571 [Caerostris extrusa]|uniref:Uncharacterized protein n=1 Tax=Caerostris extrusa TaxID=172846 RepID=A0AAV4P4H8_CAEEX|nr:hypothetical protein CEXT_405571 [Caerostris extrusa]